MENEIELKEMRSAYTGDCEQLEMIEWMKEQLKCLIENGTVKYCEDCDWLFPVGADHAL